MKDKSEKLDRYFFWRRIHSLMGLLIVLFLIEHMITNSQSALLFGESGIGFIHGVNFIKNLPYLPVIEIGLIGVPILLHGVWGVRYALTGKFNSYHSDGSKPSLPEYGRNRSYTWQRITSWILLIGIIGHVAYMRFYRYPIVVEEGAKSSYFVRVSVDPGLYTVASRLNVALYNKEEIRQLKAQMAASLPEKRAIEKEAERVLEEAPLGYKEPAEHEYSSQEGALLSQNQLNQFQEEWLKALSKRKLTSHEVIAVAHDFGTAVLLTVRDAFKSPFEASLYTVFVLAAAFHAFNGLWTFMITWGIILKMRSQKQAVNLCIGLMILIAFLGLASVWGTYWINLKH